MEEFERSDLLRRKVPGCCPFCRSVDGKVQRFFDIHEVTVRYYDAGKKAFAKTEGLPEMRVFCSVCEEEIRQEDVKDGVLEDYKDE